MRPILRHRVRSLFAVLAVLAVVASNLAAKGLAPADSPRVSIPRSGGETTVDDAGHNAFGRALDNADPGDWPRMWEGKRIFIRRFSAATGLGPVYDASSCSGCHFKDGRGGPPSVLAPAPDATGPQPPPLIYRLGPQLGDATGWGAQLQAYAVDRAPEGRVVVTRAPLGGRYADGTPYELHQPHYRLEGTQQQLALAPRVPPTLVGIGLLEAVATADLLAWADPDDTDDDGISGRPRWLATEAQTRLGRFGWKADQPTLLAQTAAALAEDIGITTASRPAANRGPVELSDEALGDLVHYLRMLAPPAQRRDPADASRIARGERRFVDIGCAACHRPTLRTASPSSIAGPAALAEQTIHPYTDLLLHDLGPALADPPGTAAGDTDPGAASVAEWRTAPLWGLGLLETVNGGLHLLHDGRARSFEEAILWHGGEAEPARRRFEALAREDRDALVAFLKAI